MSNIGDIWLLPMSKSIKDRGQCTRSNKIIGNFGQLANEKTLCRYYRPIQHKGKIGLNLTCC